MLAKKSVLFLAIALGGLVVITIFSYNNLIELQENSTEVQNSYQIQDQVDALVRDITSAESGSRGFLLTKKYKDALYLARYNDAVVRIPQRIVALDNLLSKNNEQKKRFNNVKPLISNKLTFIKQLISLAKTQNTDSALALLLTDKGENLMNQIILQTNTIKTSENYILQRNSQKLIIKEQYTLFILFTGRLLYFVLVVISVYGFNEEIIKRKNIEIELAKIVELSEEKFKKRTEQFVEANKSKDKFLTDLSQKLRAPLASILGWTKLIKAGNVPQGKVREGIDNIDSNAKFQLKIVDDVLDISLILQGKLRLSVRQIELSEALNAAIASIKPDADAKSIKFILTVDATAFPVLADFGRLQQVFFSILCNAVKYTSSRGTVQIKLEKVNNQAQVLVKDNGIGIDSVFLPHIFDQFTQKNKGFMRPDNGLGLSLAISKQLIESHSGTINASSDGKGQGATFVVTLPLMSAESTYEVERINLGGN